MRLRYWAQEALKFTGIIMANVIKLRKAGLHRNVESSFL